MDTMGKCETNLVCVCVCVCVCVFSSSFSIFFFGSHLGMGTVSGSVNCSVKAGNSGISSVGDCSEIHRQRSETTGGRRASRRLPSPRIARHARYEASKREAR